MEVRVDADPGGSSVVPAISAQSPALSGVQVIQNIVSSPVTVQCLPPVTSSFLLIRESSSGFSRPIHGEIPYSLL